MEPEILAIANQSVAVGSSIQISVSATDPDGEPIHLSVLGLPDFAQFVDLGDGAGTITADPLRETAAITCWSCTPRIREVVIRRMSCLVSRSLCFPPRPTINLRSCRRSEIRWPCLTAS